MKTDFSKERHAQWVAFLGKFTMEYASEKNKERMRKVRFNRSGGWVKNRNYTWLVRTRPTIVGLFNKHIEFLEGHKKDEMPKS